jgi:hypothetical protein
METLRRPGADLRPLGLGELLDRTFTLYRNHFWLFCGIMVVPEGLSVLISVLWALSPGARAFQRITANPPADPRVALAGMASGVGATFILSIVHLLIYIVAVGAVTYAVADLYLQRSPSIQVAYRQAARRAGAVIGLCFLLGTMAAVLYFGAAMIGALGGAVLVGLGGAVVGSALGRVLGPIVIVTMVILAVLGGLALVAWVLMRFAVSMQILLLEGRGVFDSLNRSGSLTAGNRWRIFLGVAIMVLIVGALGAALTMPFVVMTMIDALKSHIVPTWLQVATAIAGGLNGVITGPLLAITMALIYYDLRIRKEGFDIEAALMAVAAEPSIADESPAPAAP